MMRTRQVSSNDQPTGEIRRDAIVALICASIILALSLGIRHGFGLFLQPISMDAGWGREVFSLAMAAQNLVWGISQPFAGLAADRFGAGKVVFAGGLFYAAGLALMAFPENQASFLLSAGLLIGLGLSGTTFPVIFAALGRAVPPARRSWAMGVSMAGASFGQFAMLPLTLVGINWLGWSAALLALAVLALIMVPLALPMFKDRPPSGDDNTEVEQTALEAARTAVRHRGFWLLSLGFFVCGFQIILISVHLPSFLLDQGLEISVGTTVLAVIGLVNIAGTYYAGVWGGRVRKPMILAWLYLLRGITITAFILFPVTASSAYVFAFFMGIFWLSTVPLTNGTVASIFGVRNLSMLGGLVFFIHQLGGFLGGWLGGALFDYLGSYDLAWGLAIILSFVAALLNLPITEKPAIARPVASGDGYRTPWMPGSASKP